MDFWIKATGTIAGTLLTLYLALVIKHPRVCLRIAQMIGSLTVSITGLTLMAGLGAFFARQAVISKSASVYAIADGELSGDTFVRDQLASAVDPLLSFLLGTSGIGSVVVVLCLAAIAVSKMVIEDEANRKAKADAACDTHQGDGRD